LAAKYYESCGNFLMAMLEVEQNVYTQNLRYLSTSTEKWLSQYKDERAGKGKGGTEEPTSKPRKLDATQASASAPKVPEMCKFGRGSPLFSGRLIIAIVTFDNSAFGMKRPVGAAAPDHTRSIPSAFGGVSSPAFASFKPLAESSSSSPPSTSAAAVPDSEKINSVLAQLAELGYSGVTPDDFGKLRPVDEFETEITVMSEVRGYFQVRCFLAAVAC
jgi:hypothetical protein